MLDWFRSFTLHLLLHWMNFILVDEFYSCDKIVVRRSNVQIVVELHDVRSGMNGLVESVQASDDLAAPVNSNNCSAIRENERECCETSDLVSHVFGVAVRIQV